ncbi:MAG: hypothetical protein WC718_06770 [Phycisphaerales bacterium]|jgi:hypothetical protein
MIFGTVNMSKSLALRVVVLGLLGALAATLGGCNAAGPPTFQVQAGDYQAAFNISREVLRDYQFDLERVDAAEGVITTADKSSAGLATPWDGVQTTAYQQLSDLGNDQARRVRITFLPVDGADASFAPSADVPCVGDVHVVIRRVQSALVRPSSRSIQLTTTATDPALAARGIYSRYDVPVERDEELENRIARRIEARLAEATKPKAASASPRTPPPGPRRPMRGPREIAKATAE